MEKNERETVIVINHGDIEHGYFSFGTSERSRFSRLCKRIGGRNVLMEVREDRDSNGYVRWWQCHVPIQFLSLRTFAIGRKARRNTTKALASRKATLRLEPNVGRYEKNNMSNKTG